MRGSCPANANPERSLNIMWTVGSHVSSDCISWLRTPRKEPLLWYVVFFLRRQSLIPWASRPTSAQLLTWRVVLGTALALARPLPALCVAHSEALALQRNVNKQPSNHHFKTGTLDERTSVREIKVRVWCVALGVLSLRAQRPQGYLENPLIPFQDLNSCFVPFHSSTHHACQVRFAWPWQFIEIICLPAPLDKCCLVSSAISLTFPQQCCIIPQPCVSPSLDYPEDGYARSGVS